MHLIIGSLQQNGCISMNIMHSMLNYTHTWWQMTWLYHFTSSLSAPNNELGERGALTHAMMGSLSHVTPVSLS